MLIGFDASRAFVQEVTGTENYSLNLLRALAKVDRVNNYRVYLREPIPLSVLGSHPSTSLRMTLSSSKGQLSEQGKSVDQSASNTPGVNKDAALPASQAKRGEHTPGVSKGTDRRKTDNFNWPATFEFVQVRPHRLWTQLGLSLETWKNPVDLLFVPAHTLPVSRNPKVKTVVTIHDLGVEYLPGYHQFPQRYYLDFASRYAAGHADALIAVSEATKSDLIRRYQIDREKIFVVAEGVDGGFFKPQSKSKAESVKSKYKIKGPYILFVGTVQPRKNLRMLIEAFGKVYGMVGQWDSWKNKNKPTDLQTYNPNDLQLVIAGRLGWDYADILAAPGKLGIEDRVKFLGHVPTSDLPTLYSGAGVFAFPSLFEGFGLPILEAISCGCPVIASDIAPHREINSELRTHNSELIEAMVLLKPNDVDNWADVLYQYVTEYKKRYINQSKLANLVAKFSWEETTRETLQVFNRVLG